MSDYTAYVVGFMFGGTSPEGVPSKVALIRKKRPGWQRGKLNGIGGHIEASDIGPDWAMVREFEEETGCKTDPLDWAKFAEIGGSWGDLHCYRTFRPDYPEILTCTDEQVGWYWMHSVLHGPIHGYLVPNLKWLIPLALYRADTYDSVVVTTDQARA